MNLPDGRGDEPLDRRLLLGWTIRTSAFAYPPRGRRRDDPGRLPMSHVQVFACAARPYDWEVDG